MTEANSILDGINGTVAHRSQHPPAAYPAFRGIGVSCSVNTEIYGLNKRTHTHTLTHTHIGTQTGVGYRKKRKAKNVSELQNKSM